MGRHKINNVNPLAVEPVDKDKKEESREALFIRNLFLDMDVKAAGRAAGYSEAYISSTMYQKFRSPRFQNKIRDFAASLNYSFLPKVLNIHRLGLEAIEKDLREGGVEKASKLKHISRDSLRMAGLLNDEGKPGVSFVNVENLQAIIQQKLGLPVCKTINEEEED
jgi:hypothetical protein